MTRYFYIDPLAAAWMAKHFGMKFENGIFFEEFLESTEWGTQPGRWIYRGDQEFIEENKENQSHPIWPNKVYIHPDSVKLLEPQIDDLVETTVDFCVDCGAEYGHYFKGHYPIKKIIQRNGIAFMWPEAESVTS